MMATNPRSKRVIWVVRHGERADNIDKTWRDHAPRGAWDDPPLSTRGKLQAQECGMHLAQEPFGAVFCSPFLRCVQTVDGIIQRHSTKLPVFIEQGICETLDCCQNPPGCLTPKELSAQFPVIDVNYQSIVPNPEPEKDILGCKGRLTKVIDTALQKYEGALLFVTHGCPTAMIHEILTGNWHYVGQCTISKFVSDDQGVFKAVLKSDFSHLSDKTLLRDNEFQRPMG